MIRFARRGTQLYALGATVGAFLAYAIPGSARHANALQELHASEQSVQTPRLPSATGRAKAPVKRYHYVVTQYGDYQGKPVNGKGYGRFDHAKLTCASPAYAKGKKHYWY